eukprot:TRINITY_DN19982_c0_g1_i1.p1 TRINITY_DN19982_c0_g1~~TRINITY_DN19982_c0_g1_i1.p1  ORF type:complete len:887 (+),score=231.57 TRINITY_DN19982_c0_g1_i1:92-2662(+)
MSRRDPIGSPTRDSMAQSKLGAQGVGHRHADPFQLRDLAMMGGVSCADISDDLLDDPPASPEEPEAGAAAGAAAARWAVGDRVRVRNSDRADWQQPGTVHAVEDGQPKVKLDGRSQVSTWAFVERLPGGGFAVGDRVRVRNSADDEWQDGTVYEMDGDTPRIKLDGQEDLATWTFVEPVPGGGFQLGDKVRVRDSARDEWRQPGTVDEMKGYKPQVRLDREEQLRGWTFVEPLPGDAAGAAAEASAGHSVYGDSAEANAVARSQANIRDLMGLGAVSLADIRQSEPWTCPDCHNTGEGEDGKPIMAWEAPEHRARRCPYREVICAACSKRMKATDRKRHAAECTGPVVACRRCGAKVRRVYAEQHKQQCVPFGSVGSLHLRVTQELQVAEIMPGGAADTAGIQAGDVIVRVDNPVGEHPIATRHDFQKAVGPQGHVFEGTEITLHVLRGTEAIRKWKGSFSASVSARRLGLRDLSGRGATSFVITVGSETVAARDVRRKRMETFRSVFPKMKLDMIDEFITEPEECKKHCLAAFTKVDKEGGGYLDAHEMHNVFVTIAEAAGVEPPSKEDAVEAFNLVDVDGNGVISFDEFFPYIRALFLSTFWGEGPQGRCHVCGLRIRERHRTAHTRVCLGIGYPRGSLQLSVHINGPCKVTGVRPGGMADRAGVKVGEIITKMGIGTVPPQPVTGRAALLQRLAPSKGCCAGQKVVLELGPKKAELLMAPLGPEQVEAAVKRMKQALQSTSSGSPRSSVDVDFARVLLTDNLKTRDMVKPHFESFDTDGTGFFHLRDIRTAIGAVAQALRAQPPTDAAVDDMFKKLTPDMHASLALEEILPLIRRHFLSQLGALDGAAEDSLD